MLFPDKTRALDKITSQTVEVSSGNYEQHFVVVIYQDTLIKHILPQIIGNNSKPCDKMISLYLNSDAILCA